eukprot:m.121925 g.121925  ORF g.121925 m.121925 type:complete len:62 (+) comp13712_c0_seq6:1007-1192(+)
MLTDVYLVCLSMQTKELAVRHALKTTDAFIGLEMMGASLTVDALAEAVAQCIQQAHMCVSV